jgi:hypothetical protein
MRWANIRKGAKMSRQNQEAEHLNLNDYIWSPPLPGSGTFERNGDFRWDDETKMLSYHYGGAILTLWINYEKPAGLFRPTVGFEVSVIISGIPIDGHWWNTVYIESEDLRNAVEMGLVAWQAQVQGRPSLTLTELLKK